MICCLTMRWRASVYPSDGIAFLLLYPVGKPWQ
jgi:hypothetical protein